MEKSKSKFLPALEGVRGYAFIAVFLVHYLSPQAKPSHLLEYPWFLLVSTGWLAVPLFFAVSGYLITGILFRTKGREGFFRVFYTRRALRVFPLYYLVLGGILLTAFLLHKQWEPQSLAYFLYLQNVWSPDRVYGFHFPLRYWVDIDHLWSLAVEEQFYIAWPLIIWFCKTRESMLRVCYGVLVTCFLVRLGWPMLKGFDIPMVNAYYSTLTRVDGIVCGAIVALWREGKELPKAATKVSYWLVGAGVSILVTRSVLYAYPVPWDSFNVAFILPLANVIASAVLVLLLAEHTWVSRVCSYSWICKLGRLSYGLYVFHFLYLKTFTKIIPNKLVPIVGSFWAPVLSATVAFLLTWVLALITYRLIEEPALRAKEVFRYGQMLTRPVPVRESLWARAFRPQPIVLSLRM